MPKIFLSYRRSDTSGYAGRLYDQLSEAFGRKNVFMDLDDIAPGKDFSRVIEKSVGSCDYLLVLMGDQWLKSRDDEGKRRIDDPRDFVHREVSTALNKDIEVIPVIVKKAPIPTEKDLPGPLERLAGRQVHELTDARWEYDANKLIESLGGGTMVHKVSRSKWPRRFAIFFGFVVAMVLLLMFLTRGVVQDAEEFLALLAQGDIEAAYDSTATAFRTQTSQKSFEEYVTELGLLDNASASWTSRAMENNQASLNGSITTKQRAVIPLAMELLKEGGVWRVLSLTGSQSGVFSSTEQPQLPTDEELSKLVHETLLDFDHAVQSEDFSSFHRNISQLWKSQTTPLEFMGIFQSYMDQKVTIVAIREATAVFDQAPVISKDGLLILSGYYPTSGMKVHFKLKYLYEHPDWRLAGIRVSS